ncbi:MAG TPA: phosphatase PAP2 family protein [Bacteroidales bacterium]|nr:phosphatase PAP2 family protein [Bacteroidales bacterium]
MIDDLTRIDEQLFLALNGQVSPFIDQLMFFISEKYVWIPFYIILLAFIIRKYHWKTIWIVIGAILLITLTDQLSNVLKDGVKRFRPCKDLEIGHLVHIVNNYCRSSYGFVSGHAANSMALAVLISLLFRNKWVTFGMVLWAVIVSYSRVYLGVHFPGDVMGGWLVGLIFSFMIYYILRRTGALEGV